MLVLILCIMVGYFLFDKDYFISCVMGLMFCLLFNVTYYSYLECTHINSNVSRTPIHISNSKIVSISSKSNLEGRFFLGCGSIGETEYYYFYEDSPMGYKKRKVLFHAGYIKEDVTPSTAYVEVFKNELNFPVSNWIIFRIDFSPNTIYVFHIPPNSIIRDFTLE